MNTPFDNGHEKLHRPFSTPVRHGLRILLAALLIAGACSASAQWKTGSSLPALKTFSLEGAPPPSMAGKVIVVDFWASWCGPCKASFPVLNALQQKYSAAGLIILAINEDEKAESMKTFLDNNPVSFTVIRDVGHKLVAAAGVESMPTSFVIDRSGKVRYIHTGFHGDKTTEKYNSEIELLLKEGANK
jgi:thiol-disulfide isomerase/thioredoxin